MKSFREFILEAKDAVKDATYTGDAAEQERIRQRDLKRGFDPDKERAEARRKAKEELLRNRSKNTTVPGGNKADSPFSGKTPPKQPSGGAQQTQTPSRQPSGGSGGTGTPPPPPSSSSITKAPSTPPKGPGLRSRFAGSGPALTGALEFASRKSQGQSTTRAATGAVASGLGWMKGAELGAKAGSKLAGPRGALVGGVLGGLGGQALASSAVDAIPKVGPSEKDVEKATQRYGMRKARQGMAASNVYGSRKGSAITGVGGSLKVDKKAGTITSGGKTATLGKTQLIRDPKSGKQVVGDLLYKGGKPVYIARPSTASRDSNASPQSAWRNVQRALNIGGQRERDVAAAKKEYRTALKNTQTYQKQLGIKPQAATKQKLPGQGVGPKLVGPKIVGPKIVGPKPTPSKPAGGGMGGARGSGSSPGSIKPKK